MQFPSPLTGKANDFAAIDDLTSQILEKILLDPSSAIPEKIDRHRVRRRVQKFAFFLRRAQQQNLERNVSREAETSETDAEPPRCKGQQPGVLIEMKQSWAFDHG